MSLAKELAVARQFGAGHQLDAYLAAFTIVTFLPTTLASVLQSTFIPAFFRARHRSVDEAWRFSTTVITVLSVFLLTCTLIVAIGAPVWLALLAPGFSPATKHEAFIVTVELLPLVWLIGLNELFKSLLNALKSFAAPAASQALPSLGALSLVLAFGRQIGIGAVAAGWLIGIALQTILLIRQCRRKGLPLQPRVNIQSPDSRSLARISLPYVAVALLPWGFLIIDQHLASQLGPGAISVLSYADKIFRLPLTILIAAIYTSMHPFLSEAVVQRRMADFASLVDQMIRAAIFLLLPIGLTIVVLRVPLVTLIYQRGAFGAAAVASTAGVLLYLGLLVPTLGVWYIYDRALTALSRTRILMVFAAGAIVSKYVLSVLLEPRLGLVALPLATLITFVVAVLAMHFALVRAVGARSLIQGVALVRTLLAGLVAGTIMWAVWHWLGSGSGPLGQLAFRVVATGALGAVAYLALAAVLRLDELTLLLPRVARTTRMFSQLTLQRDFTRWFR